MIYGHQIKQTGVCNNNNLDHGISGLVWNGNLSEIWPIECRRVVKNKVISPSWF